MTDNRLVGNLHDQLTPLQSLQAVALSRNQLFGQLFANTSDDAVAARHPGRGFAAHLPLLSSLDVEDNQLEGTLPAWLTQRDGLRRLQLRGNSFRYPEDDEGGDDAAWQLVLSQLVRECKKPSLECDGLPPNGCEAFGASFVVKTDNPDTCLMCTSPWGSVVGIGALFVLAGLGLAFYVRLINKHPDAMKRWVSTSTLAIDHLQTLSIVGNLKLHWPPAVHTLMASFSFNMFEMLSAIRPECLLVDVNVSSFYFFNIVTAGSVLLLLLALVAASQLAAACGKTGSADAIEIAASVIFSAQLTVAWRVCHQLILTMYGGGGLGTVGGMLAFTLLGVQVMIPLPSGASTPPFRCLHPSPRSSACRASSCSSTRSRRGRSSTCRRAGAGCRRSGCCTGSRT